MNEAEKWLREHDPKFTDNYLTAARVRKVHRWEIPFSAYSEKELEEIFAFGRKIS